MQCSAASAQPASFGDIWPPRLTSHRQSGEQLGDSSRGSERGFEPEFELRIGAGDWSRGLEPGLEPRLRRKCHLDIELREFWLPVCAQILVPEAARHLGSGIRVVVYGLW